jgi:hypothetical protein
MFGCHVHNDVLVMLQVDSGVIHWYSHHLPVPHHQYIKHFHMGMILRSHNACIGLACTSTSVIVMAAMCNNLIFHIMQHVFHVQLDQCRVPNLLSVNLGHAVSVIICRHHILWIWHSTISEDWSLILCSGMANDYITIKCEDQWPITSGPTCITCVLPCHCTYGSVECFQGMSITKS